MAKSSLLYRTLGAVLLVVAVFGCALLHPLCCAAMFALALTLMTNEFYRMSLGRGTHTVSRVLAMCLITGTFVLSFLIKYYKLGLHNMLYAFPMLLAVLTAVLLDKAERIERLTAQDICFPMVYLLPSFVISQLLLFDRTGEYSPYLFLAVMVLVWMSDVGAYFIGMAFGQRANSRKLAPHISPKKSWAGVAGGLLFTLATAVAIHFTGIFAMPLWKWLVAATIVVVLGIIGDLFESLVKRHYSLKDAGTIVIGHGGMLDRFDAALFAIPAVTIFFIITEVI